MGQYYYIVNLDKKEFIHPHDFRDGIKLMEFGSSSRGTMTALAILLADGNGRGGGDLGSDDPIVGSWAGNRIVIAGDYADPGKYGIEPEYEKTDMGDREHNLFKYADLHFTNISQRVITAMMDDAYLKQSLVSAGIKEPIVEALTKT